MVVGMVTVKVEMRVAKEEGAEVKEEALEVVGGGQSEYGQGRECNS